jgi:hypothetical protein
MARPLQRTSPSGFRSWGIGEERPSLMSVSSSTTPTPTSRRSGNGSSRRTREPPSGPMTAAFAPENRTSGSQSSPSFSEPPSNRAWKGTRGVRSTFAKGRGSTKLPSSNSSAPRWRLTPQRALNGQPRRNKPGSQGYDVRTAFATEGATTLHEGGPTILGWIILPKTLGVRD